MWRFYIGIGLEEWRLWHPDGYLAETGTGPFRIQVRHSK